MVYQCNSSITTVKYLCFMVYQCCSFITTAKAVHVSFFIGKTEFITSCTKTVKVVHV